jgi:methyl-coenzyme M reductase subunit D
MVKIDTKSASAANDSTITGKKEKNIQIEIFPQRILNFETTRKLIEELNTVEGITRIVLYGSRLPPEDPEALLQGTFGVHKKRLLNIKGEQVELTVQVGKIWVEIEEREVRKTVRAACEKVLPFSFDIYDGMYIRTKKTVTDYIRKSGDVSGIDDTSIGMFDHNAKKTSCCGSGAKEDTETDLA